MDHETQLNLISRAWGRQSGFCFFPVIPGDAVDKKDRVLRYDEGPAFLWPKERGLILERMKAHTQDDLYWCPSLFEGKRRKMELAMDEHCLWADLDEVNPTAIADYPPTISWETSPGRYQALWLITGGDIQGASWPGRENQCLTYHLGADLSGWDSTQLLRIPGWYNHKPEYRSKNGSPPLGKVITTTGRRYLVDEFNDLPDVPNAQVIVEVLEDEIDRIDRHAVWGRVRLKVSHRVRELISARSTSGDRSEALWEIERELADAGCSVPEIVAVVKATIWNKFDGRSDEIRRLTTEAAKAVGLRDSRHTTPMDRLEVTERPVPTNLFELVRDLPTPQWLVRDVLTEGSVGFIAGQPKAFKSWVALDLALSVASGQSFLGHFPIELPGPVLYIQEEDSGPMVKKRLNKVWPGKMGDKMQVSGDGAVEWLPGEDVKGYPPVAGYIGQSFTVSDSAWQVWLDEMLAKGYQGKEAQDEPFRLLVLDPLMMMAGDIEENRAQQMTEFIFKPLKVLARKHRIAIQIVHHLKKTDPRSAAQRGGQLLLGSVANHAWAEDSMYFKHGRGGVMICEQESKHAQVPGFVVSHIQNKQWEPIVTVAPPEPESKEGPVRRVREPEKREQPAYQHTRPNKVLMALAEQTSPATLTQLATLAQVSVNGAFKVLQRAQANGYVTKMGRQYTLTEKGKEMNQRQRRHRG
jgi:predicted transcriptional regulator